MEGLSGALATIPGPSNIIGADPGMSGGGTYTSTAQEPSIEQYEAFFGPAARDIKRDPERNRRRQRLHLPDALKGPNPWMADRIDGLITDTSSSPFTSIILPYKHIENVDGKIKWNVWSFDEGMASRVPYESAARVLTQTKRSYAGYTVRQGLAISMEANFMMTQTGRENFLNQLKQVVGSIQHTNDFDVIMALLQAMSYQSVVNEKYFSKGKTQQQQMREYVDLFGFLQKNPNGLDIAIEEAKEILRSWGAKEPNFMLCNSKLTMQLQMTPERTQYLTQGEDGIKRLKQGPDISSYRGIKIIHSRSFSVETGARPRDLLNRRVRVAEYYRIPWHEDNPKRMFELYDESRDSWFSLSWRDLIRAARLPGDEELDEGNELKEMYTRPSTDYTDSGQWNDTDGKFKYFALEGSTLVTGAAPTTPYNDRKIFLGETSLKAAAFICRDINLNDSHNCAPNRLQGGPGEFQTFCNNIQNREALVSKWIAFFYACRVTPEMAKVFLHDITSAENVSRQVAAYVKFMPPGEIDAGDYDRGCCVLPCVFASMLATSERHRSRINDCVPSSHLKTLRQIFNSILEGTYEDYQAPEEMKSIGIVDDAHKDWKNFPRPPTNNNSGGKRDIDPFLIFLWVMNIRMFTETVLCATDRELTTANCPQTEYHNHFDKMMNFISIETQENEKEKKETPREIVIFRPNIEHNMLGIILGRGGIDDLGATLWGQTQLECYSDSMHGIWGMSYKYNERAMVFNEKNLIRLWDVCYGSYSGGKDSSLVDWTGDGHVDWNTATNMTNEPYEGPSMAVMSFNVADNDLDWVRNWPSPISYHSCYGNKLPCDPDNLTHADDSQMFPMSGLTYNPRYLRYQQLMPDFTQLHVCNKSAGDCAQENVASIQSAIAFQGSMRVLNSSGQLVSEVQGCGHHGPDYVGVASKRNGKGMTVSRGAGMGMFAAM